MPLCAWLKLPLGQFVSYCEIRQTFLCDKACW